MLSRRSTVLLKSGTYHRPHLQHLHVVCTDPDADGRQILVSICTLTNSLCDQTCVLKPGEHRFISKPSYVSYRDAALLSQDEILSKLESDRLMPDQELNKQTFLRVSNGLCKSLHTPRKLKRHLGCAPTRPDPL